MHSSAISFYLMALFCLIVCPGHSEGIKKLLISPKKSPYEKRTESRILTLNPSSDGVTIYIKYVPNRNFDLAGGITEALCYQLEDDSKIQAVFQHEQVEILRKTYDEKKNSHFTTLKLKPSITVSNCLAKTVKSNLPRKKKGDKVKKENKFQMFLFQRIEKIYTINEPIKEVICPLDVPIIEIETIEISKTEKSIGGEKAEPTSCLPCLLGRKKEEVPSYLSPHSIKFKITSFLYNKGMKEILMPKHAKIVNVGSDFVDGLFTQKSDESHDSIVLKTEPVFVKSNPPMYTNTYVEKKKGFLFR